MREIKWHQESIDSSLILLLKANKEEILKELILVFGNSKRRAEVYLSIDGKTSVGSIADKLGMKIQNVSPHITKLKNEGLIEIKNLTENSEYIYKKTELEKIFKLSSVIKKKFGLNNE
ncbi:MAG: hypothetical protein ACFFDN_34995 [Candidatus Hodarchaeota archaeon]